MYFEFGQKSAFLLFFFFHGIVFSTLLFIKGRQNNDKSNYWLSLFVFLCALYVAPFMLGYAGWYSKLPYRELLFYLPLQQLFLISPVLYFYFKTLLDQSFTFKRYHWIHFIPAVLYNLYIFILFIIDKIVLKQSYFYENGRDKDFDFWYQFLGFVFLLLYLILSLKTYITYKKITYNNFSYADTLNFKWSERFIIAFLILLILRILFFILNPEWDAFGSKFWYYLSFSLLFYYISISGFVNSIQSVTNFTIENPTLSNTPLENKSADLVVKKIAPEDLNIWKSKIEELMQKEALYQNPKLTIIELAQLLNTHPKKISQIINQGYNLNFNDFVNDYRVHAVIQKMEKGHHTTETLLGIAFDCGFNSKSTFNRAFKRLTSLSPNNYIKNKIKK